MNVDNLTDKTRQSITAAIQLARDYANAQGESLASLYGPWRSTMLSVHPAHLAFVLLNESQAAAPGSKASSPPLFASVIQRAGGDPVSRLKAVLLHRFTCIRHSSVVVYKSSSSGFPLNHQLPMTSRLALLLSRSCMRQKSRRKPCAIHILLKITFSLPS